MSRRRVPGAGRGAALAQRAIPRPCSRGPPSENRHSHLSLDRRVADRFARERQVVDRQLRYLRQGRIEEPPHVRVGPGHRKRQSITHQRASLGGADFIFGGIDGKIRVIGLPQQNGEDLRHLGASGEVSQRLRGGGPIRSGRFCSIARACRDEIGTQLTHLVRELAVRRDEEHGARAEQRNTRKTGATGAADRPRQSRHPEGQQTAANGRRRGAEPAGRAAGTAGAAPATATPARFAGTSCRGAGVLMRATPPRS